MKSQTFKISKITLAISFFLLTTLLLPSKSQAHERQYAFTQEYRTIPQNQFEIEQSVTSKVPEINKSNSNTFDYSTEVEWGITDHWTLAHYQTWQTENHAGYDADGLPEKDPTKYSGFKFETKYRFGEKGKYWLDPLIYFEIAHDPREVHAPVVLEEKIVLSKDIGRFNVTYNQIMESVANRGGRTEHEFLFGANYAVLDDLHIGVEVKGQYWNPEGHHNEISVGPAVSWANQYFWITSGILFGANRHTDDIQTRVTVGVPIG